MKKNRILIKILILIFISLTLINRLYSFAEEKVDENLKEKFRLLEEVKKEIEEKALKELKPWRGQEYKYVRAHFSGQKDENGRYCFTNGGYNSSIDYNNYVKIQDYIYEGTKEHFKQYLNSENENEKLKGYFILGFSNYTRDIEYKEQDDIEAKITLFFVPEVKSSKWCEHAEKAYTKIYSEKNKEFIEIDGYFTHIYVRLVWENDKYVIKFMDNKPEGYDEFVARMKEHGIDVENIDYPSLINANADVKQEIQAAEKKEFDTRQTEINILNNWIIAVCSTMIILIIMINLIVNKNEKK